MKKSKKTFCLTLTHDFSRCRQALSTEYQTLTLNKAWHVCASNRLRHTLRDCKQMQLKQGFNYREKRIDL